MYPNVQFLAAYVTLFFKQIRSNQLRALITAYMYIFYSPAFTHKQVCMSKMWKSSKWKKSTELTTTLSVSVNTVPFLSGYGNRAIWRQSVIPQHSKETAFVRPIIMLH